MTTLATIQALAEQHAEPVTPVAVSQADSQRAAVVFIPNAPLTDHAIAHVRECASAYAHTSVTISITPLPIMGPDHWEIAFIGPQADLYATLQTWAG